MSMNKIINIGNLVLVRGYGEDDHWAEVVAVHIDYVVCTNGFGTHYIVYHSCIADVTDDDSVLK